MFRNDDKKGALAFLLIVLICLAGALAAYRISGNMGIEERFQEALGLDGEEHGHEHMHEQEHEHMHDGPFGFAVEGNPLLYLASVLILGLAALAMYVKYWR
jgi:hypothetical protein